jgi:hypothetical protein
MSRGFETASFIAQGATTVFIGAALLCNDPTPLSFIIFTTLVSVPGLTMVIVRRVPPFSSDDRFDWVRMLHRGPGEDLDLGAGDGRTASTKADIEAHRRAFHHVASVYGRIDWIGIVMLLYIESTCLLSRDSCRPPYLDGSFWQVATVFGAYSCVYFPTCFTMGRMYYRIRKYV